MESSKIPEPRVSKGKGYPWYHAVYLHLGAGILRNIVWSISGSGTNFDKYVTIETPGLGTGRVRCAVCLPRSPGNQQPNTKPKLPLVLVIEGGGFVLGHPENGEHNDRLVSDKTQSVVISVDYAKAPRHPFPHALLQLYEVLRWTLSVGSEAVGSDIDPSRVAIMGNSAGGNLTAALSLLLSITSGPCARFREGLPASFRQLLQILLYPSLECHRFYRTRFQRSAQEVQAKSLPIAIAELMEESYLPPYVEKEQIFVAPVLADVGLLNKLQVPRALILVAGLDCLKDEAEAYAHTLQEAGVPVKLERYPQAIHGFSHYKEGSKDFRKDDVMDCWKKICEDLQLSFQMSVEN
ncbi:hypothetical protein AJ79_02943 [Helicocarpus griseus UAMH5409]|uniref:Alpha/beta hydrolase fold-3 domain-containing protein n=1 Tax=Helicocarpus griseus UAMH5409 TaxID=1447875 RepID=A0A2B7Y1D0_9EURO|nr:hypothetical protein AJ79_02943 [Helicocarpus griseus UAMH5409]